MRFGIFILAVTFASPLVARPPVDDMQYRLSLLPVPGGCDSYSFVPHGLAETGSGAVAGSLKCSAHFEAVAWIRGEAVPLHSLGGPGSHALGISPDGTTVVGQADTLDLQPDGTYVSRPVIWRTVQPVDIGTLGGPLGAATDLNRTLVVGGCQSGGIDPRLGREAVRACAWDEETITDLGDLGGPEAVAYAVNAHGWTVGWSNTEETVPIGNDYRSVAFLHDGSHMTSLGSLGGAWCEARSVNSAGTVVGVSETNIHGSFGQPEVHGFVWKQGEIRDLGKLAGSYSEAWDINDRGEIVGMSHTVDDAGLTRLVAVRWSGGTIVDLNGLVDGLEDWHLTRATAIDNSGRILVQAERPGAARVGLLDPVQRRLRPISDVVPRSSVRHDFQRGSER